MLDSDDDEEKVEEVKNGRQLAKSSDPGLLAHLETHEPLSGGFFPSNVKTATDATGLSLPVAGLNQSQNEEVVNDYELETSERAGCLHALKQTWPFTLQ